MPVQVIDLRSFVRESLNVGPGYNDITITPSQLANVFNINVDNIESQFGIQEQPTYNSGGKYYAVVGYNKVGDGSVIGP